MGQHVSISVPAKIILFGEYFVLRGQRAYGATLSDAHIFDIAPADDDGVRLAGDVPFECGAAQAYLSAIWREIRACFDGAPRGCVVAYRANFPHHYGWGGSSAAMLALIRFARPALTPDQTWRAARAVKAALNLPGSGMDMYLQIFRGAWVPYNIRKASGPKIRPAIEKELLNFIHKHPLYFVSTGLKANSSAAAVAARRNPKLLAYSAAYRGLMRRVQVAFKACDWPLFRDSLNAYVEMLFEAVAPSTDYISVYHQVLSVVKRNSVALKPCGALGGDGFLLWSKEGARGLEALFEAGRLVSLKLEGGTDESSTSRHCGGVSQHCPD